MSERITLDLSGTEDATKAGGGDFPPLPKGWYHVVIYSSELRKTKPEKGSNPYLNSRLNVIQEGDYYKRVVFDGFTALYITENAPFLAAKAEQLSRIIGLWDGQDRSKVVLPTPDDIQGVEVEAYIVQERDEYAEGKYEDEHGESPPEPIFRNSVRAYRPVGGWPDLDEAGTAKKPASSKGKRKISL